MIETERLLLRQHTLDDFDTMHAIWSDPEVVRFISAKPSTRAETWNRLNRNAGHWALLGYGLFATIEKASGSHVGDIGVARFERGLGENFDPFDEAGWVLTLAAQGKGYATEAMAAIQDWHSEKFGPRRTVCIISPEHRGSLRVAEKLGYRQFGEQPFPGTEDDIVHLFERLP